MARHPSGPLRSAADRAAFIRRQLAVQSNPDLPGVALYMAHPGSGLSQLGAKPPYWAYVWAGGAALARYVLESGVVAGKRVLDLGAGSGVVAMAAARAGAAAVMALEPDPWGRSAVAVNAALNGMAVRVVYRVPPVDLILCGDVFYGADVARAVLPVLDRARAAGVRVLVGDPGRADLPLGRLVLRAEYPVRDVGDGPGVTRPSLVYDYAPDGMG